MYEHTNTQTTISPYMDGSSPYMGQKHTKTTVCRAESTNAIIQGNIMGLFNVGFIKGVCDRYGLIYVP
jgi:hypothetical protein